MGVYLLLTEHNKTARMDGGGISIKGQETIIELYNAMSEFGLPRSATGASCLRDYPLNSFIQIC